MAAALRLMQAVIVYAKVSQHTLARDLRQSVPPAVVLVFGLCKREAFMIVVIMHERAVVAALVAAALCRRPKE
jgi:hypothetical protein